MNIKQTKNMWELTEDDLYDLRKSSAEEIVNRILNELNTRAKYSYLSHNTVVFNLRAEVSSEFWRQWINNAIDNHFKDSIYGCSIIYQRSSEMILVKTWVKPDVNKRISKKEECLLTPKI